MDSTVPVLSSKVRRIKAFPIQCGLDLAWIVQTVGASHAMVIRMCSHSEGGCGVWDEDGAAGRKG